MGRWLPLTLCLTLTLSLPPSFFNLKQLPLLSTFYMSSILFYDFTYIVSFKSSQFSSRWVN